MPEPLKNNHKEQFKNETKDVPHKTELALFQWSLYKKLHFKFIHVYTHMDHTAVVADESVYILMQSLG